MKVELLYCTENALNRIARMAHSTRKNELEKKWEEKISEEDFVKQLIGWGHEGPFEHIIFTFYVSEISKNLTHQLVRHRIASYLQQSSRHTMPHPRDFVEPPSITKDMETALWFRSRMMDVYNWYGELMDMGIPVEDARYLLPSGYFTHILITMNCRELRHFFKLRCAKEAQWEIRNMAKEMLRICHEKYPVIFEDLYKKYLDYKK